MGQFDQNKDAEEDKEGETDKMHLLKTLLFFFPEIHPVSHIEDEADDRDYGAKYTGCCQ